MTQRQKNPGVSQELACPDGAQGRVLVEDRYVHIRTVIVPLCLRTRGSLLTHDPHLVSRGEIII